MKLRIFLGNEPRSLVAVVAFLLTFASLMALTGDNTAIAAESLLAEGGKAKAAIFVSPRVWDDAKAKPEPGAIWTQYDKENQRRRLRESVRDFAEILQRITGANFDIVAGPPAAGEKRFPMLIGELAEAKFGKPQKKYPLQQGFRIVVAKDGLGFTGESDLATSYALYTLLDQLGCRWFIPSPMGEVLPSSPRLAVPHQDLSSGPATVYRGIWFADNDYGRRNRLGGLLISAGHNLEHALPKELRTQHPEIRAVIGGKPHPHFIKWTHPLVADALVNVALDYFAKNPDVKSYSLSPDDGATWDESDDAKHDAGDYDAALQTVAKADRLLVLCNRVATRVTAKHPDVRFGMLAYVDYTRPPVREKVHPAIVPQVAPITFSRAQPMNDDGEPNNKSLRYLVEGWGKASQATSYYFYGFYLAEVSSPNPMIGKWGHDIPYIYAKGNCQYWQPETLCNFETSMHALYMGLRLAWDKTLDPNQIVTEFNHQFYGKSGKTMDAYWRYIDEVWVKTPEYAGCGWGHMRRWTPDRLTKARGLLTQAASEASTDMEKARVKFASDSLQHFELFMKMRRDLAEGKYGNLAADVDTYTKMLISLGEKHQPQYAFARMGWTGERTLNVRYFDAFYKQTYEDADRVSKKFSIITPPLRSWRYQQDTKKTGEAAGWSKTDFNDAAWKTTDPMVDTWSKLGFHNYMGSVWYRTTLDLPAAPAGKKTYLWIGSTDGRVKVFVNGQHVPYVDAKGTKADAFSGYCQPASFDITAALVAAGAQGQKVQISLLTTREAVNELGSGGLLAAPMVYREK